MVLHLIMDRYAYFSYIMDIASGFNRLDMIGQVRGAMLDSKNIWHRV
jgi:hypothetical protein